MIPYWSDFVRWVFWALIFAEEQGITHVTSDLEMVRTTQFGPLRTDAFYSAVSAVGNYGEVYERNFGQFIPRKGIAHVEFGKWTYALCHARYPDKLVGGCKCKCKKTNKHREQDKLSVRCGGGRERERMGSLNKTLWKRTRTTMWTDKTNAHDPTLLAFQVITKKDILLYKYLYMRPTELTGDSLVGVTII